MLDCQIRRREFYLLIFPRVGFGGTVGPALPPVLPMNAMNCVTATIAAPWIVIGSDILKILTTSECEPRGPRFGAAFLFTGTQWSGGGSRRTSKLPELLQKP
jgi:hypothetical protein